MQHFDLVVMGSGPAGQRAAIQAAKLGKLVAVVERSLDLGGVCINTGTIPSKTLREAVIDLSGLRQRALYGDSFRGKGDITVNDLLFRTGIIMRREREVVRDQLLRNRVHLFVGAARFAGPHEIVVEGADTTHQLQFDFAVIAVGSEPGIPADIAVDHEMVLTSDDILTLDRLPRNLTIVGAGIIGMEYATIFATLGVDVTLVDMRPSLLEMIDREIVDVLTVQAREMGVTIRLGEEVARIDRHPDHSVVVLKSGKRFVADRVLVSAGRRGATDLLGLDTAGLAADSRGRVKVNRNYQTEVPHIYAAGDVIGFPALASTSMEQGRLSACHAFGVPISEAKPLYPFGVYAIPEVAWVGETEAELTAKGVPFETGVARYKEIARGQILGDPNGMLKLIFGLESKEILGVWGIGSQATELVHIGQAVMVLGGTLDYFVTTVFNYPTLAECYKVAALDGYNKLYSLGTAVPARASDPVPATIP